MDREAKIVEGTQGQRGELPPHFDDLSSKPWIGQYPACDLDDLDLSITGTPMIVLSGL